MPRAGRCRRGAPLLAALLAASCLLNPQPDPPQPTAGGGAAGPRDGAGGSIVGTGGSSIGADAAAGASGTGGGFGGSAGSSGSGGTGGVSNDGGVIPDAHFDGGPADGGPADATPDGAEVGSDASAD